MSEAVRKATYQCSSKSAADTKIRKKPKHVLYKPTTSGSPLPSFETLPPLHELTQILSLSLIPWPDSPNLLFFTAMEKICLLPSLRSIVPIFLAVHPPRLYTYLTR